ncbi:MAG: winged helix-turn-helix domain-containing protein [Pseudomonadota bacterium]
MLQEETTQATFRLGAVDILPTQNRISGEGGASVNLEPKVMDVLCALADADGETLSRDRLIDLVWGVEFGGDESLSRAISILRKALRQLDPETDYIETVPKRGYRLKVRATPSETLDVPSHVPTPETIEADLRPLRSSTGINWPRYGGLGALVLAAFAIIALAIGRSPSPGASESETSLAVLPFDDLSETGDQQYLVDGLSEELLTALSAVDGLKVPGRTSSFSFRGQSISLAEIGKTLDVDHLLEGSVRRQGDDIRIAARLVRAEDGAQLWAGTFNGETRDVFELQEDMAQQILAEISPQLAIGLPSHGEAPNRRSEAMALYLRGKGQSLSRDPEDIRAAIAALEEAVSLDPDFSEAHAQLANALAVSVQLFLYSDVDPKAAMQRAGQAADRAIALNPTLAAPYAVLGLKAVDDADYVSANRLFDEALSRNANHVDALRWKALLKTILGHLRESDELLRRAVELDPQWPVIWQNLAFNNLHLSQFAETITAYNRALELGMARIPGTRDPRSEAALLQGDPDQAYAYWMSNFEGQDDPSILAQRVMFETVGRAMFYDDPAAHEMLERAYQSSLSERGRPPLLMMLPQLHLGNTDRVMELLATTPPPTEEERFGFPALAQLIWEPGNGPTAFRNHPQFLQFAETRGFRAAWDALGWPDECQAEPSQNRPGYCPIS